MVDKFIELFTGYEGDFGIADMSSKHNQTLTKINLNQITNGLVDLLHKVTIEITLKVRYQLVYNHVDQIKQHSLVVLIQTQKNYASFKVENYLALFQQFKLPLVPLLSKSGGLHCYLFLKEPIPTVDLISALKSFLLPLGLDPDTEIFPKQKELKEDDKGEIKPGNFINLPYYNNGEYKKICS